MADKKKQNRQEMHRFLERLLEGKDPAEALATLKEILVEYFGFGSSIGLDELAVILGQVAQDYNEDGPKIEEPEEDETQEKKNAEDIQKILDEIDKLKKSQPAPVPYFPPQNPPPKITPTIPDKITPDSPWRNPEIGQPWWEHRPTYTIGDVPLDDNTFRHYVSSLANTAHQEWKNNE